MHAEILLWLGRYRSIFVPLIGFSAITLKWFGVISAESIFAEQFGVRQLLLGTGVLIVVYVLFERLIGWQVRRSGVAGHAVVVSTIFADIFALFMGVALLTPPEYYGRALIISIFTVQITQIFFG